MTILPIDELNTMSVEPEKYFGEMNLTKEQIDERIQFTKDANDVLLDVMMLIVTMGDYGAIDYDYIRRTLVERFGALIAGYVLMDDYLWQYVEDYAENFTDNTKENIWNDWYISEDRALYNAENSANDTLNYKEYKKAIDDGFAFKTWRTEHDMKVRPTHSLVDGKKIPIEDLFVVGGVLMRFPKDYELAYDAPRELIGCRCTIKYSMR